MKAALIAGLILIAGCTTHAAVAPLDAKPTHGAVDPAVTQGNIHQTICVKGYTAKVRPPLSYTAPIKRSEWMAAGHPGKISDYELDHIVPLEVGGAPRNQANLALQAWAGPQGAHAKDLVENRVHDKVCAGTVTLAAGQRCFLVDWTHCP
jgi:hypothetical protein